MQIRNTAATSVRTVQGCLWLYCFNALGAPALVHNCIRGFHRHFLLTACGNTAWKLSSLGAPTTAYHLQAVLDLPTPLNAKRKPTWTKQCLTSLRSAHCSSQPGKGASASKTPKPGVSWAI